MRREPPPLPDEGIYRAILIVLVASIVLGTAVMLVGALVLHNPAISQAGAGLALVCSGVYLFFRWLGRREMRKRDGRDGPPR